MDWFVPALVVAMLIGFDDDFFQPIWRDYDVGGHLARMYAIANTRVANMAAHNGSSFLVAHDTAAQQTHMSARSAMMMLKLFILVVA